MPEYLTEAVETNLDNWNFSKHFKNIFYDFLTFAYLTSIVILIIIFFL